MMKRKKIAFKEDENDGSGYKVSSLGERRHKKAVRILFLEGIKLSRSTLYSPFILHIHKHLIHLISFHFVVCSFPSREDLCSQLCQCSKVKRLKYSRSMSAEMKNISRLFDTCVGMSRTLMFVWDDNCCAVLYVHLLGLLGINSGKWMME